MLLDDAVMALQVPALPALYPAPTLEQQDYWITHHSTPRHTTRAEMLLKAPAPIQQCNLICQLSALPSVQSSWLSTTAVCARMYKTNSSSSQAKPASLEQTKPTCRCSMASSSSRASARPSLSNTRWGASESTPNSSARCSSRTSWSMGLGLPSLSLRAALSLAWSRWNCSAQYSLSVAVIIGAFGQQCLSLLLTAVAFDLPCAQSAL